MIQGFGSWVRAFKGLGFRAFSGFRVFGCFRVQGLGGLGLRFQGVGSKVTVTAVA